MIEDKLPDVKAKESGLVNLHRVFLRHLYIIREVCCDLITELRANSFYFTTELSLILLLSGSFSMLLNYLVNHLVDELIEERVVDARVLGARHTSMLLS